MHRIMTAYPLKLNATFKCNDPLIKKMWTAGFRNVQQLAAEVCYQTPYYEQLHYTGDTRIQGLISLYLSGEDLLMKKAILDFQQSRSPENPSEHASNRLKILPTFSLFWVSMVYDYWMHRKDDELIRLLLPTIEGIMDWYERQIKEDQEMLGAMTWWSLIDWEKFNGWGITPGLENARSATISLQYAYTLKLAAQLFSAFGNSTEGKRLTELAEKINDNTMRLCFNDDKALLANSPEKNSYCQHTNIWAILSGAVEDKKARKVMIHLLYDKSIGQAICDYRFYLIQALKKVGLADQYIYQLKSGELLSEFTSPIYMRGAERIIPKCKEWNASPNYYFLSSICGICPSAAAFQRVRIQPSLGTLTEVEGSMPHPSGTISVKYKKIGRLDIHAEITLPENIEGEFIWNNKMTPLYGGTQTIKLQFLSNPTIPCEDSAFTFGNNELNESEYANALTHN